MRKVTQGLLEPGSLLQASNIQILSGMDEKCYLETHRGASRNEHDRRVDFSSHFTFMAQIEALGFNIL